MHQSRFFLRVFILALSISMLGRAADADLHTYYIQTVEWLVDNSDLVAVVEVAADQRKVLHVLKGEETDFEEPLHRSQPTTGYSYLRPRSKGPLRLLFLRKGSEILEEISLPPRSAPANGTPLRARFLGATQEGHLILSESELLDAVRNRIQSGPERQLALRKTHLTPHAADSALYAPPYFPLENSGETHVLVVPFGASLQEHYLQTLLHGTAEERLYALHGLSHFDTVEATDGIRKAETLEDVVPSFLIRHQGRNQHEVLKLEAKDVRDRAKKLSNTIRN